MNGSFETGDFDGWVTVDLNSPFFPLQVGSTGLSPGFGFFVSDPTDGVFAALHGWDGNGPAGPSDAIKIAQDIVLPIGAAEIQFDFRAAWDKTFGATQPREFLVDIEPFGGGSFMQRDLLLTADPVTTVFDTGNLLGIVDVSAFAGSPVRISFEWTIPENFTGPAFFQLDNVQLIEVPVANRTLIIKQGACPAPVNPSSHGLTLMLLVGDVDFDVSQVDLSSLELSRCDGVGGVVAPHLGPPGPGPQIVDLNHNNDDLVGCVGGDQVPCACNEDQSSDGIDDLKLWFRTSDMAEVFLLDEAPTGTPITLFLTGELADGSGFAAADCIQIVGPPVPPGVLLVDVNSPDLWIAAAPLDVIHDGGGFGSFERAYPQGTTVILIAPPAYNGLTFVEWFVNGEPVSYPGPIAFITVSGEFTTASARYTRRFSDVPAAGPRAAEH